MPLILPSCLPLPAAVTREAATLAEQLGVRIFTADIIYHLFDQFTAYLKQVGWVCEGCGGKSVGPGLSVGVGHAWFATLAICQHSGCQFSSPTLCCTFCPCPCPSPLPQVKEEEQEAAKLTAVFPCVLKILPTCIFNQKDPIILGVEVGGWVGGWRWVGKP